MSSGPFDLVTVGGGLGASALAISMAKRGARVLVLEKETEFRDRVRGEALSPWGVAEARELGIADLLLKGCAKEVPWLEMGFGPRNLIETTPQKEPFLTYCHPEMQEVLLAEAEQAGAQVRRGVTVEAVEPGANNAAVIVRNTTAERISARLVVGSDGRGSAVRKWAGFVTEKSPQPFHFAGVLLTGFSGRDDLVMFLFNPDLGLVVAIVPEPGQRCRAYLGYPTESGICSPRRGQAEYFSGRVKARGSHVKRSLCRGEERGPAGDLRRQRIAGRSSLSRGSGIARRCCGNQ
jgi:2-polyprenyl-6-methoxyphenol hydroxylase-like FAD-dependent oxidoreductase